MGIRESIQNASGRPFGAHLESLLDDRAPVYVLAPPPGLLVELTTATFRNPPLGATAEPPLRILADREQLSALFDTFEASHKAAELIAQSLVTYRAIDEAPVSAPLVVAEAYAATVVVFGQTYGIFETDRSNLASLSRDRIDDCWTAGTPVSPPDRPEWRTVTTALAEHTSEETLSVFRSLLDARRAAPEPETLDVVTIAVLAGARTQTLQRDVARWCTDQSVAAASTVSIRKSDLADRGIVSNTRDPPDGVGAPVKRLMLADDHLAASSVENLYDVVATVMTEN